MFQDDFPNAQPAVHSVDEDAFDVSTVVIDGGKEGGILGQEVAEQRGVAIARGFAGEVLG